MSKFSFDFPFFIFFVIKKSNGENIISISILRSYSHTSQMERENNLQFKPKETKEFIIFSCKFLKAKLTNTFIFNWIHHSGIYTIWERNTLLKKCFEIMFRAVRFISFIFFF